MKGKFIRVLIALTLVLSFSLVTAVPAGAEVSPIVPTIEFVIGPTGGIVEWTTDEANSGSYSVELSTEGVPYTSESDYGEGRVIMSAEHLGLTLADVTSFSFYWKSNAASGLPFPYFALDTDSDNVADRWLIWNIGPADDTSEATSWTQWSLSTAADNWHVAGPGGPYSDTGVWGDMVTSVGGTAEILSARIAVGNGSTNLAEPVFVDDIEINGTTYDLEPRVINTDTIEGFNTIQAAIDDADTVGGHTISVVSGNYTENVVIDKALTLQGAAGATIAPATLIAVEIQASNVTVDSFTITPLDTTPDVAQGIAIVASGTYSSITLSNNIITTEANHGIYIAMSTTGLSVTDNDITVVGVSTSIYADGGAGLSAKNSGWTISGNTLSAPAGANLEMYDVDTVLVDSNTFMITDTVNLVYSSEAYDVGSVTISNNAFEGNGDDAWQGVIPTLWIESTFQLWDGSTAVDGVTITGNTFDNWKNHAILIGEPTDPTGATFGLVSNVVVNNNDFLDTGTALANYTGNAIDAEDNWWGNTNGPTHSDNTFNVGNQGSAAVEGTTGTIDYVPWFDALQATGTSFAPVNNTTTGTKFSSIQAAIDAVVTAGNTILVAAGIYTEDLTITKALTVQSEDGAITDEAEWDVVTELDGDVYIWLGLDGEDPLAETAVFDGFYIYDQDDAIYIHAVNNGSSLTISNNVLANNLFGIVSGGFTVDNASSVTIEGNYILDGYADGIFFGDILGGSELTIRDNEIVGHSDDGIHIVYLAEASTVTIEDNRIADNDAGIEFDDVDESAVTIAGNTIGAGYSELEDTLLDPNYVVGILFGGGETVSDSTITIGGDTRAEGNIMVGSGYLGGDGGGMGGIYVVSLVASSLEILNNDIVYNSEDGIYVGDFDEDSTVDIHLNSIVDNDLNGVYNLTNSAPTIDAKYNWWGDVAGPDDFYSPDDYYNPYNLTTNGDSVEGNVDYIPWMIQKGLAADWNIWSRPIAPDAASWAQLQADLVDAGVEAIYYFDSATQLWGTGMDDAGLLDAFYIKVPDATRIRYYFSDEATFPSQKEMTVGWNFIGLAELDVKWVSDALDDAYWGTGETGLWGYNKVISPSLNGYLWTQMRDGTPSYMYPTRGYWVLMVNDGVLGGFTTTPIVEVYSAQ